MNGSLPPPQPIFPVRFLVFHRLPVKMRRRLGVNTSQYQASTVGQKTFLRSQSQLEGMRSPFPTDSISIHSLRDLYDAMETPQQQA